ncbi:FmdB family zinc ribbon protein [Streptomyces phaeochromogenes]|uniref:FmdB family transcriptional regulator n=1 Tax=Streptomyces phaeochromogenes TaxID=1923 RepID=A0ABZ1HB51_STRPH|nr:FmdB family zinc ribbon protein [Streptomyces phaeochromogenes]MCX5604136.1 FmdB family transcriptional regulator [Streptomyces phaeochromogenes]WSD15796.1 FmdB family transcriptional regulator [Streptomyces phaeochromogenes]WSJ07375.1 FmdB family transcriptional regulator [Streptomyces phaeochromogenes]WSS94314.1 FmdB family transcriptional regulator [Streptomyces phaeochromogenes]WSW16780.1 FmdB family transcriptional regulator [Streptomyces phaeochromogenes]
MPTYQYQCTECGEGLEAVQKFTDDALTVCPSCDGRLKKVFSAVGIVFKGSGFYRNDSRGSSSSSSPAPASKSSGGSSDSKSSTSSDSSSSSGSKSSSDSKSGSKSSSTSSSSGSSNAA